MIRLDNVVIFFFTPTDGGILILSSNLTGQYWNGSLNYFPSGSTVTGDSIYKTHTAKEMYVGVADGVWCDSTHVVVGTDEGWCVRYYIF